MNAQENAQKDGFIAATGTGPLGRSEPSELSEPFDPFLRAGVLQPAGPERRSFPRFPVDCPISVTVLAGGSTISGQLVDLSQGGCRLSTPRRIDIGILVRVEARFQLRGLYFRIVGVTAGTRTGRSFAIRFLDMPKRAAVELAEVIAEVAAGATDATAQPLTLAGPLVEPVAARSPVNDPPATYAANGEEKTSVVRAADTSANGRTGTDSVQPSSGQTAPEQASPVNRRSHRRHQVDTRATLTLVRCAISMPGYILNLSQGGCRLRTDERFNVGIHTQVEAEFYLHGLPFRVAGVSQAIMDRNTIGIRFLDMSERRREQLLELIAEIEEAEMEPPGESRPSRPTPGTPAV